MSKDLKLKIDSTICGKIHAARMSERERQLVLHAMRDADMIVDAILWVVKKIEHLGERLFLKPSFKH